MKFKHIAYTLLLAITSTLTQAQVKIGKNPTTIATGALLDIEGSTTTTRTVSLTNGNFGIGTDSPTTPLQVIGAITASTADPAKGSIQIVPGNATGSGLIAFNPPGATRLGFLGFASTSTLFLSADSPNSKLGITNWKGVGIGTDSPSSTLDVIGNVKITDGTQGAAKILTSDANGFASWQSFVVAPYISMSGSVNANTQSPNAVVAATNLVVSYINNVGYDPPNGNIIIQQPGLYFFTMSSEGAINLNGSTAKVNDNCGGVYKNGSLIVRSCARGSGLGSSTATTTGVSYFAAGDLVAVGITTASDVNTTGQYNINFNMFQLSR